MRSRLRLAFVPIAALWLAGSASAEFYKWTDSSGIVHFTANLDEVPPSQRAAASAGSGGKGSFQRVDSNAPAAPAPAVHGARAPVSRPTEPTANASPETYGGRNESQWRADFQKYRSEIERLEAGALQCEDDSVRWAPGGSKRKWDEEQNEAQACANVRNELDMNRRWLENLEETAHRAGVPPGWVRD